MPLDSNCFVTSPRWIDLAGQRYGRLTAIRVVAQSLGKCRTYIWECSCDCGAVLPVLSTSLRSRNTQSCGCYSGELRRSQGGSRKLEPALYLVYRSMLSRCYNPSVKCYRNYGGRGIQVCDRWRESFANFLADMGPKPSPDLTLERIDNDGDYKPSNCRWATPTEQNSNKRNSVYLEFHGVRLTVQQWTDKLGMKRGTVANRIRLGWSVEQAIQTPVGMKPD